MTTTPRPRLLTIAVPILLIAGAVLRADDRYQRSHGGFGRVEGRPDREEVLRGARPYETARHVDTVGLRPYERREAAPAAPAPAPRRSAAQYFPGMRSGQYTAHTPIIGHAHCTPSRIDLGKMR